MHDKFSLSILICSLVIIVLLGILIVYEYKSSPLWIALTAATIGMYDMMIRRQIGTVTILCFWICGIAIVANGFEWIIVYSDSKFRQKEVNLIIRIILMCLLMVVIFCGLKTDNYEKNDDSVETMPEELNELRHTREEAREGFKDFEDSRNRSGSGEYGNYLKWNLKDFGNRLSEERKDEGRFADRTE